ADELGMMNISDSSVEYGETPMKCRFGLIVASGHCLDPALHRQFANLVQQLSADTLLRFAGESPMLP
ncbi:hypothetical protein HAX54_045089, partial [Datura stramonium]|nr:hypothetical protein [Datura stramonium]